MSLKKRAVSFIVCLAFVSSCPMTLGEKIANGFQVMSVSAISGSTVMSVNNDSVVAGFKVTVTCTDGSSVVLFALRDSSFTGYGYFDGSNFTKVTGQVNSANFISNTESNYDNCLVNVMVCGSNLSNTGFVSIKDGALTWSQSDTDGESFLEFLNKNVVAQNNLYEIVFNKVKGSSAMATAEDNYELKLEPVIAVQSFDLSLGKGTASYMNVLMTPEDILGVCNQLKTSPTRVSLFGSQWNSTSNESFLATLGGEGNGGVNYYSISLLADTSSQTDEYAVPTRPYITYHSCVGDTQLLNQISVPNSVWSEIVKVFEYAKEEGVSAPSSNLFNFVQVEAETLRGLVSQALTLTNDYSSSYKEAYKSLWEAIIEYYEAHDSTLVSFVDNGDSTELVINGSVIQDTSVHDIVELWSIGGSDSFVLYRDYSENSSFNDTSVTLTDYPAKFYCTVSDEPVKFARGSYNIVSVYQTLGEDITVSQLLKHPYSLFVEASVSLEDEDPVNSLQESLQPPVLLCYEDDSQTESSLTISRSVWEKYIESLENLMTGSGSDENSAFNLSLTGVSMECDAIKTEEFREQWRSLRLFNTILGLDTSRSPRDLTSSDSSSVLSYGSSQTLKDETFSEAYDIPEDTVSEYDSFTSSYFVFNGSWLLECLADQGVYLSTVNDSAGLGEGKWIKSSLGSELGYYASTDSGQNFGFFDESAFIDDTEYDFSVFGMIDYEGMRSALASCFTDSIVSGNSIDTTLLSKRYKSNVNPVVIDGNSYYTVSNSDDSSVIPVSFVSESTGQTLSVSKSDGSATASIDYGETLKFMCQDSVLIESSTVINPGKNLGENGEYWSNGSVDSALKVSSSDTIYDPVVVHLLDKNVISYEILREFTETGSISGVDYEILTELSVGDLLADPYHYGIVYTSLSEQTAGSSGSDTLTIPSYVHSLNARISGRTGLPLLSDFVSHSGLESLGAINGNTSTSYVKSSVSVKEDSAKLSNNGDALLTFEREFNLSSSSSILLSANTFQRSVIEDGDSKGVYSSASSNKNISLLKLDSSSLKVESPSKEADKEGETSLEASGSRYNCYDNGTTVHLRDVDTSKTGYSFHPYWLQYEATEDSPYYSLGKSATIPEPYRAYSGHSGYYFGSTNTKDSSTEYSYELVKVYDSERVVTYSPAVYVDIEFDDCLKLTTNWATDKTSLELMSKSGFPVVNAGQAVTASSQSQDGYTVTITATTLVPKSGLDSEIGMNCNGRFSTLGEFKQYVEDYYVAPLTNDSSSKVYEANGSQFKTAMQSGLASTLRGVYYDSSGSDTESLAKLSAFDFESSSGSVSESEYDFTIVDNSVVSSDNSISLFLNVAESQEDIESLIINSSNSTYYKAYSEDLSKLVNPSNRTDSNEYQIADYFDMVTLTYTVTVDCPESLNFVVDLEETDSRNSLEVLDTDRIHTSSSTNNDYVVKGSILGDLIASKSERQAFIEAWQNYFGESIVDSDSFSCYGDYAKLSNTVTSNDYCFSHFLVPFVTVDLDGYLKALGATCGNGKSLEGHSVTLTDSLGNSELIDENTESPVKYLVGSQTWLNVYGNIYDNT